MKPISLSRAINAVLALAVAVSLHDTALAQESKLATLKVGGGSFTTYIAQAIGIFAKYGLQIQIPRSAAGVSEEVRRWLASGDLDLADYGVDNAIAMEFHANQLNCETTQSIGC
jgi:ABC-type nitrate/sulfonate/bicarbonate transport system substrate-binding protein